MSTVLRRPGQRIHDGSADAAPVELGASVRADPRYQAFMLLRIGFTVLPIAMGIDKYFNAMTSWPQYLADWINNIVPGSAQAGLGEKARQLRALPGQLLPSLRHLLQEQFGEFVFLSRPRVGVE